MTIFGTLIILTITLACQNVQSKVIIVNTSGGSESTKCCIDGICPCSSLSIALQNVNSDTIIIITSKAIEVKDDIKIGSGSLNNVTITSSIATITCTSITIYCELCNDLMISGITWVDCSFVLSNSFIVNCTLEDINFLFSGNVSIDRTTSSKTVDINSNKNNAAADYLNLTISESNFYSFFVHDSSCLVKWNITVVDSNLGANGQAYFVGFSVCADVFFGMCMVNVQVDSSFFGINLELSSTQGNISVSILSSHFIGNIGTALSCKLTTSNNSYPTVLISDTEFINSRGFAGPSVVSVPVVDLSTATNATSTFTMNNVNFTSNSLLFLSTGTLSIVPTSHIEVFMTNVNFITNEYSKDRAYFKTAALYIKTVDSNNTLIFSLCNFISNNFSQGAKVVYIDEYTTIRDKIANNEILLDNCSFLNNTVNDVEEIIYISGQSDDNIEISNTVFSHNVVNNYIINAEVYSVTLHIFGSNFISNNVTYGCASVPTMKSHVFLISSQFINNIGNCLSLTQVPVVVVAETNFTGNLGSCIYLVNCHLYLSDYTLFDSNIADRGAALFIDQGTFVTYGSPIHFVNNSASLGGAIYVDLSLICLENGIIFDMAGDAEVNFKDNVARDGYSGGSLYFSISKECRINTNASDPKSLMYIPYRFKYSQLNSTNCCDISCSHLHNTGFPAITSPRYLILCSDKIKRLDNVTYYINNTILGKPAVF